MSMFNNAQQVGNVSIPISRFEELLDIETRVNVLFDYLAINKTIPTTRIAHILGNSELATMLEEDDRRFWEEFEKKEIPSADDDLKGVFMDED